MKHRIGTMSSDAPVGDVDRLFQCFKCGITPPESCQKERKLRKSRTKNITSAHNTPLCDDGTKTRVSLGETSHRAESNQFDAERSSSTIGNRFATSLQISPLIFYGSPQGIPPKKPRSLWRLLLQIKSDLISPDLVNLRKEIWATFPRQDEAMKFAKEHIHARVFSYQDHLNGQRRFLVSTYLEFWRRYEAMSSKYRHHYEVIQEGLPCHLYFDLEFTRRVNADRNGDEMVDLLVSVVLETLLEKYCIQGCREWTLELDSSNEEKFSRHVIFRIPGVAFKDNSHVGAFVAEICYRIVNARETDTVFEKLFVLKETDTAECPQHLFVDTAVYSRNRCFRMFLSTKAGKESILLSTGRFRHESLSEEEIFMKSLICNMDVDCVKLLVCKVDEDCVKTLRFETETNIPFADLVLRHQELAPKGCINGVCTTYLMGKSPFPSLDLFVESIASMGNISGRIRSWYLFSEYGLMVYSMSRNRYCERIGREHKSNHVMYVVDLQRAVYYQKCHDPDCKGYRSPLRPVPTDVMLQNAESLDVKRMGTFDMGTESLGSDFSGNILENVFFCQDHLQQTCRRETCVEAVCAANDVKSMQCSLDAENEEQENGDDDEESWWQAVDRTASQIEQSHFQLIN